MATNKHLFEDFHLDQAEQQVGGVNDGLVTAGQGTMVITINYDSRRPHKIKISNSLFLPDLRVGLLLPQHWAQVAGDNYPLPNGTRMEINATNCTLIWGQGQFKLTIPFDSSMNTSIFFTSPSTSSYQAFFSTPFMPLRRLSSGRSGIQLKCTLLVPCTTLVLLSSSFHSVPEIGKTKEKIINKDKYFRDDNFLLLF
jgi:hypothetical protein